ncbi:necrosis inducing protein-domain-containing protein [Coprinopsis sp. MPI-PUGE-AT-0042]|nr:necrosis inducing protein-domain-containing protein [Coprinopsis sp. MPI-PUGE-AT-0042]
MLRKFLFPLLAASVAFAAPIDETGVQLAHDAVRVIPESLPNDCSRAGLAIGGSQSGSCGSSEGQAYVRGGWLNGKYGLMYAWYYPKDQTPIGIGGHRHDWEGAVLLAHMVTLTPSPPVPASNLHPNDGRVLLKYWVDVPVFGTHCCWVHEECGTPQPLVSWDSLSANARLALESVNWGSGKLPSVA